MGAIDADKEKARLLKEKENLEKLIISLAARLENQEFISRAPVIVQVEQEKLAVTRLS